MVSRTEKNKIKRKKIIEVASFNVNIAMREDFIWFLDVLFYFDNMYVYNKPYYHYRQTPNGATRGLKFKKRNLENLIIVSKELQKILAKRNLYTSKYQTIYSVYFLSRVAPDLSAIIFDTRNMKILNRVINDPEFTRNYFKGKLQRTINI